MRSGVSGEFSIGARLQEILHELNLTQADAAALSRVDRSTINDIVLNKSPRLSVKQLKRILDGIGVTMGRFFKEPSLEFTAADAALAHEYQALLARQLVTDAMMKERRRQPPVKGSRRRKKRETKTVPRGVASAGPRETYPDVHHLPNETIPAEFYQRGARYAYQADGDSMVEDGIMDKSVLYVRPAVDSWSLDGKIAICNLNGSDYVKRIDTRGGQILLRSSNPRYEPMPVDEDVDTFRVIGEVLL